MRIGELARRSGCNVETIRYYERIGILQQPPRSTGRYRLYGEETVGRLRFVRRARELGFGLERVRKLLELSDLGAPRAQVRPIAASHLTDVRKRIADLQKMEAVLAEALHECACSEEPGCPVMEALQQATSE